jgi:putative transposase
VGSEVHLLACYRGEVHTAFMSSYPKRRHQRLREYAYSTPGFYFVTLCVQDRRPLLGRISDGVMLLSPAGEMVKGVCEELPQRYAGVEVDTLMVMPDHLHVILVLTDEGTSLSKLIQGIKSGTTPIYAREVASSGWPAFKGRLWQKGFYDRVIRDDEELAAARQYVMQNAMRWWLKRQDV